MPYFRYNNNNIHFTKTGEGPLLIIMPGNTASSAAHAGDLKHFSDRFTTAAIDFLGTGRSDRIGRWPVNWWDEAGSQAAALVEHLGFGSASLLGVSGGAIAALSAAARFGTLFDAVVADSFSMTFTEPMFSRNVLSERSGPDDQQKGFWAAMHGSDWADVVENDTEMIRSVVDGGGRCCSARLQDIGCPVLLTYAEGDSFIPDAAAVAEETAAGIPDCRLLLEPGGGHPLIWTKPAAFYGAADGFLNEAVLCI